MLSQLATTTPRTVALVAAIAVPAIVVAVRLFGLTVPGALGLYFILWWTLLFAVLPFGAGRADPSEERVAGTEPGAPALPRLREKAIWTSLATDAVLLASAAVFPLAGL